MPVLENLAEHLVLFDAESPTEGVAQNEHPVLGRPLVGILGVTQALRADVDLDRKIAMDEPSVLTRAMGPAQ